MQQSVETLRGRAIPARRSAQRAKTTIVSPSATAVTESSHLSRQNPGVIRLDAVGIDRLARRAGEKFDGGGRYPSVKTGRDDAGSGRTFDRIDRQRSPTRDSAGSDKHHVQ